MALDAATAQELIRKLTEDRNAYLESLNKTTELLIQAIAASGNIPLPRLTQDTLRRSTGATILDIESVQKSSLFTGEEDSASEDGESYFAQTPLQPEVYDEDGFIHHLRTYEWTEPGRKILHDVIYDESALQRRPIFPTDLGVVDDRSHLSHYSIFDVGPDGAPLSVKSGFKEGPESRSIAIWNRLRRINADPNREFKAVGRITIVREPSPLLFGALHYTMHQHFDVDELFGFLVDHDPVLAQPHRAFSEDERHQRSFVFNMEYFTIIGEQCLPPPWQHADEHRYQTDTHIPISRCSAVVALAFEGPPSTKVRNKNRRVNKRHGYVFDPFSPWRVLSIQSYPDWHSSTDTHDSSKNYVNGPEAFLATLRDEFRDAGKRLMSVHRAITDIVEPPADFIFNGETRDKLLFEDTNFTYSRRYFWAAQTLGIMNQDIRDMIEAYNDTFKDTIWSGTDKIVWPSPSSSGATAGDEAYSSSRWLNWRKRMAVLRRELLSEIGRLEDIERDNVNRMRMIKGLHDNLFSGTSVHESRRSVEQAAITVEQGRNIKLLTLATIFFLPLTFVTSVYGMTAMNPNESFYHFGYTTLAVCLPTYFVIATINHPRGLAWWKAVPRAILDAFTAMLAFCGYRPAWARARLERLAEEVTPAEPGYRPRKQRSKSTEAAMLTREVTGNINPFSPTKADSPGTATPEVTELGVLESLPKALDEQGPLEHKPRDFAPPAFTNGEPTVVGFSGPLKPYTWPRALEETRESSTSYEQEGRQRQRKESLAGLVEFWQRQKNGRGRRHSTAQDPC